MSLRKTSFGPSSAEIARRLSEARVERIDLPLRSVSPKVTQVNAWLLRGGERRDLYDCGAPGEHAGDVLKARLDERGIRSLGRLVLSHLHRDHIGQVELCRNSYGAEVLKPDAPAEFGEVSSEFMRLSGAMEMYLASASSPPLEHHGIGPLQERRVTLGGLDWRVEIWGGHAPVSLLLFEDRLGLVLSADQVLPTLGVFVGVELTDPFADPLVEQIACLRRLSELEGDMIALPGHGEPFADIPAAALRQISSYERRLARLERAVDRELTIAEMLPALFRPAAGPGGRLVQLRMAMALANRLVQEERLGVVTDRGGCRRFSPC